MLDISNKTALILAPHLDDEVFGCGGLIHRMKQLSTKVYVLFMTNGSTQHFGSSGSSTGGMRVEELKKVAALLEFDDYHIAFEGDQYHLQLDKLAQRELVHSIERGTPVSIETIKPDIVLTPLPNDYNQDHRATYEAAMTALRPAAADYRHLCTTVLGYELPYQQWNISPTDTTADCLVRLSEENLAAKVDALELYASQLKSTKSPLSVHGVKTLAAFRGLQCGAAYAEAYKPLRLVL